MKNQILVHVGNKHSSPVYATTELGGCCRVKEGSDDIHLNSFKRKSSGGWQWHNFVPLPVKENKDVSTAQLLEATCPQGYESQGRRLNLVIHIKAIGAMRSKTEILTHSSAWFRKFFPKKSRLL